VQSCFQRSNFFLIVLAATGAAALIIDLHNTGFKKQVATEITAAPPASRIFPLSTYSPNFSNSKLSAKLSHLALVSTLSSFFCKKLS